VTPVTNPTGRVAIKSISHPWQPGIQNDRHKKINLHQLEKTFFLAVFFSKSVVLEANRLEPRSGPTYVGLDRGSSLFANCTKYWYISYPDWNGFNNVCLKGNYWIYFLLFAYPELFFLTQIRKIYEKIYEKIIISIQKVAEYIIWLSIWTEA